MLIFPYIHTVSKVATELSCETLKLKNCETFVISNGEFALPSTERVSRYATSKNAVHVVCENQVKIFFSVNRWPWLRSKVTCNFIRFNWILPSKISHKLKELFELVSILANGSNSCGIGNRLRRTFRFGCSKDCDARSIHQSFAHLPKHHCLSN